MKRLIKRHGQGPLKGPLFAILPDESEEKWLQAIELRGMCKALRSRSLYPALNWHWLTKAIKRRRNKITGRWEYARTASK